MTQAAERKARGSALVLPLEKLLGTDLCGRELKLVEREGTTQGLIQRVEIQGEGERRMVRFHRAPVRTERAGGELVVREAGDSCVAVNIAKHFHGAALYADGTITFQIMYIGEVTILPRAR